MSHADRPKRTLWSDSLNGRIVKLQRRVSERFPDHNLATVCAEMVTIAEETRARMDEISKPNLALRFLTIIVLGVIVTIAIITFPFVRQLSFSANNAIELIQTVEAAINDILLLGAALYGFVTLEHRLKRRKILNALHELRVMAHVIDMYQLTKDPQRIIRRGPDTPSSPQEQMTAFELTRYLDYCSEMLSLLSKIAALYAQEYQDEVVSATVNEIESLTTGLSRKIWQKIMTIQPLLNDPVLNTYQAERSSVFLPE